MSALQIVAAAICFPLMLVGWALLFRQIGRFVALYRVGQADPRRVDAPVSRTLTLAKEFLGHTRMSRLPVVAVAHWFTALSFLLLFGTLVNPFGQLIDPMWRLPVIGHFPPFEWMTELFAWGGFIGILVLIARAVHLKHCKQSTPGCIMVYGGYVLHAAWVKYEFETPDSEDLGDMEVSAAQLDSIKVLYHEKEHTAWIVATNEGAVRDFTFHDVTWEDRHNIAKSIVDKTIRQAGENADLFGLADVYEEDIVTFLDGLGCPRETINEPIDLALNRWRINDTD